jgi:hypothetical protein
MEKAQKFRVFTGSVCRSHGVGRSPGETSAGNAVDSADSSAERTCHILRLLSRPWLEACQTVMFLNTTLASNASHASNALISDRFPETMIPIGQQAGI